MVGATWRNQSSGHLERQDTIERVSQRRHKSVSRQSWLRELLAQHLWLISVGPRLDLLRKRHLSAYEVSRERGACPCSSTCAPGLRGGARIGVGVGVERISKLTCPDGGACGPLGRVLINAQIAAAFTRPS